MNREVDSKNYSVSNRNKVKVSADQSLLDRERDTLKEELVQIISATMAKRKLTQAQTAVILGTDQAKISAVMHGRLKDFSLERLLRYLLLLGRDVDIKVSGNHKDQGHIRIISA